MIVNGDVHNLQNKMYHFVSGGKWVHIGYKIWRFEHPTADPYDVAKAINDGSSKL